MKKKCEICNCSKFEKVWFDKIRKSSKTFTQNKEKILKCIKCDLIFLNKVRKNPRRLLCFKNVI